ncbi:hypothetical protein [Marinitoga lauensis]|nr:hypothetical protein [Marinitoga lauensis]
MLIGVLGAVPVGVSIIDTAFKFLPRLFDMVKKEKKRTKRKERIYIII